MEPKVIYEDKDLLALEKPSGWIVNDASTTTTQPVIQSWLRSNFSYPLIGDKICRDGVVHRLDKETSGVLLIAKTEESFYILQNQFKERKVNKTYRALAHGKVDPKKGEIAATVGRLPWRRDRFGVLPGGRDAITGYQVDGYYSLFKDHYSLLTLFPHTGRTHQIRIHLKHIGHPIVSDEFYAGRKTARHDRKWCNRLFLHAASIIFFSPSDMTKKIEVESHLSSDLEEVLMKLKTED